MKTIDDIRKSKYFYLNPIIAWAIVEHIDIDGNKFYEADPIYNSCVGGTLYRFGEKELPGIVINTIPANNSFEIAEYDSDESFLCIDGCINDWGRGFQDIEEFLKVRIKEIEEKNEVQNKTG